MPETILADAGVIAMDCKVAGVTVKLADAPLPPKAAEIIELPAARLLASPEVSIFAAVEDEEDQLAVVTGCVVPSE